MHIRRYDDEHNAFGGFVAWCGKKIDGLTRSYMSIDNAFMAIDRKVGVYPCHACLQEIYQFSQKTLPHSET